jgi:hypothetical protein
VRANATIVVEGVRWRLRPGADAAVWGARLGAALRRIGRGEVANLKSGRRKRMYALGHDDASGAEHLLKVNRYPVARGLIRLAGRSKARRELDLACRLEARGLPVVVPIAAGERRRAGRLIECYLLVPRLEGATDLLRLAGAPDLEPAERHALARALGDLTRRAHAAGFQQDDLAPNNVLVRRGCVPELRWIDFERARLRRRISARRRCWMIAKLDRALPGLPASEKLRFLHAYAGEDALAARAWWRRLRDVAPRLAARDAARMGRTSTSPGRRFRPLDASEGRGFARRDVSPETLAGAGDSEGVWCTRAGQTGRRARRRTWARANLLHARGLAPRPLALLVRRDATVLLAERPGARQRPLGAVCSPAERAAVERLLAQLSVLGELQPSLTGAAIALEGPGDAPRAQLVDPEGFRFSGRSGGAASRVVARRVLAGLSPRA